MKLSELNALLAKATPGPWCVFGEGSVRKPGGLFCEIANTKGKFICKPDEWEDAKLIADMRNALHDLIAAVEALKQIEIDCNELANCAIADRGEMRAWKSIAHQARAALKPFEE